MKHLSTETHSTGIIATSEPMPMEGGRSSKSDVLVKRVATAVAVSTIVQTGKGVITALSRHPLVMFSLGLATGYLAHKYRKEIISIANKTAVQSKDFILRQKENITDLLAETGEGAEDKDAIQ